MTPAMTEAQVLALFEQCSNEGRWGEADERGTLNYVSAEKRVNAAALVKSGRAVSLAYDLATRTSRQYPPSALHVMTYAGHQPTAALDLLLVAPHGFEVTHMDAVAHEYFEGRVYNGRSAAAVVHAGGVEFGSITAARDGVFTRGVLLDVAGAQGLDYLGCGDGISADDLELAEENAGVTVTTGDAVLVRSGLKTREGREGVGPMEPREGLLPDAVAWLHEREVAVFSGDCIEKLPSGYERVPMPLHQIGLVAMGLMILDSTNVDLLAGVCAQEGRSEFLFVAAPLRIPGGTGSPVNPLAVF